MSTANFRVYTGAFALISDPLRYEIYKASAPLAVVGTQTFAAPHPARTVNFLGLARVNYIFKLIQETSGGDVVIIPDYNFTPDNDEIFYYSPVEIEADVTTGVTSGTTSFTFDGTGGTEDWRGRTIYPNRVGQGPMQVDAQYTWDSATADFNLVTPDDVFQPNELFFITFDPLLRNGNSPGSVTPFSEVKIITAAETLTAADAGKKIIIKGASPYFVVDLPEGATVPENVLTYFEWGTGSHVNVKLQCFSGDTIDWGHGSLDHITGGVCETLVLFWESTVGEWRVHSADGNFLKLGRIIGTDGTLATTENNVQALDGSNMAVASYVRLYEDFVQKLPPSQVVNYGDWAANPTKFSYSNGTNFRVPDRRNLYGRASGDAVAGVYQANQNGPISGTLTLRHGYSYTGGPNSSTVGNGANNPQDIPGTPFTISSGTESRPETYIQNEFILI